MIFGLLLCLCWTASIWWWVQDRPKTRRLRLALIPAAFVSVLLAAPGVWSSAAAGYPSDSFWTLGVGGRIGVAAISSLGLAVIFMLISVRPIALRRLPTLIRLSIALMCGLGIYAIIYSASPQAYYTFYRTIFPDLPQQIVIKDAIDFARLAVVTKLAPGGSLSDHLAGIGFWAVVPFTFWLHFRWPASPSAKA